MTSKLVISIKKPQSPWWIFSLLPKIILTCKIYIFGLIIADDFVCHLHLDIILNFGEMDYRDQNKNALVYEILGGRMWKKKRENVGYRGWRQTCLPPQVVPRVDPVSMPSQSEDVVSYFKVYMLGEESLGAGMWTLWYLMVEVKENRKISLWFYWNQIYFKVMSHFEIDSILRNSLPTAKLLGQPWGILTGNCFMLIVISMSHQGQ